MSSSLLRTDSISESTEDFDPLDLHVTSQMNVATLRNALMSMQTLDAKSVFGRAIRKEVEASQDNARDELLRILEEKERAYGHQKRGLAAS